MENGKQPIVPGRFYRERDDYFPLKDFEDPLHQIKTIGITKREYFAAKAMQGVLATGVNHDQTVAYYSVKFADALLKELSKEVKQ